MAHNIIRTTIAAASITAALIGATGTATADPVATREVTTPIYDPCYGCGGSSDPTTHTGSALQGLENVIGNPALLIQVPLMVVTCLLLSASAGQGACTGPAA